MKIPCEIIRDLLPLYHDGVCSDESGAAVSEHLQTCGDCRAELRRMDGAPDVTPAAPAEGEAAKAAASAWKRGKKRAFVRGVLIAAAAILALAAAWNGLFAAEKMAGESMEPTVKNGDVCLFSRTAYAFREPERGDVALVRLHIFSLPLNDIVRIAAIPGDRVCIEDDTLYVNGEASALYPAGTVPAGDMDGEITLGEGEYFVMGDDPAAAADSRDGRYGLVAAGDILGRYLLALP